MRPESQNISLDSKRMQRNSPPFHRECTQRVALALQAEQASSPRYVPIIHRRHIHTDAKLAMRMVARCAMLPQRFVTRAKITAKSHHRCISTLPTVEDIRRLESPEELERARLTLTEAVDRARVGGVPMARRVELHHLLARTFIRLGSPLDAEEVLDEAIKLAGTTSFEDITHREAGFLLGVCYQKSGRREKALEILESVLQHDDTHWRARFHTALIVIEERRHEEAEEHLVEVLEHCPDHRQAKALLAKLNELREAAAGRLQPAED